MTPSSEIIVKLIRSTKSIYVNDPLPLALIHKLDYVIEPHIHAFINQSFNNSILPDSMKTASITPFIKDAKGNADDLNNYRPVSHLPIFSKIIERIISPQITHFLISNNILHLHQSAYMPCLSTETAICMINNDILSSRKSTLLMLLDMSAAFDTLNHMILLSILR